MPWTKARHLKNAAGAISARICVVGIGSHRGLRKYRPNLQERRNARAKYIRMVRAKYRTAVREAFHQLVTETIKIWGIN